MYDASSLAYLLKSKQLSHSELLIEWERKIKEINPKLNALVTFDLDQALHELSESENLLSRPFAGVPLPLKMLGHTKKGWLDTSASRLFSENRASQTSNFVKRFEEIGFIPFGQTNAPEFGFKNVTDPTLYGSTKNPWDAIYSAGGSSGGAAAAVAAGLFPIASASDGGGSIRIPASFTGLIGLKPTRGTMPVGPGDLRSWQGASVSFALTRSIRDTEKLFYLMRDAQNGAPYQAPKIEWEQKQAAFGKKLKIAVCLESPIKSEVSREASDALNKAIRLLELQGHEVVEVSYPIDGLKLMQAYYRMNGAETAAMFAEIEATVGRPMTKSDMELMTWAIYKSGQKMMAADYVSSLQVWDQAGIVMEELMQTYDAFLSPTATTTAPKIETDLQSDKIRHHLNLVSGLSFEEGEKIIYEMFENSLRITPYTQLANLTGQPAISLPIHISQNGLPIGVQFQAARGREDILLQLGYEFEHADAFEMLHKTIMITESIKY